MYVTNGGEKAVNSVYVLIMFIHLPHLYSTFLPSVDPEQLTLLSSPLFYL